MLDTYEMPIKVASKLNTLFFAQNNTDCVPFEEGLTEPQEEEQPKSLLEVSDTLSEESKNGE